MKRKWRFIYKNLYTLGIKKHKIIKFRFAWFKIIIIFILRRNTNYMARIARHVKICFKLKMHILFSRP